MRKTPGCCRLLVLLGFFLLFSGGAFAESNCEALKKTEPLPVEKLINANCLSPEEIEKLKTSEFKDLDPEEIKQGKEMLEGKKQEQASEVRSAGEGAAAPKPPSGEREPLFERYLSDSTDVTARLKPFGYELFGGGPSSMYVDLPVASDYAMGPGDEVGILLWGRISGQYNLTVSREGTIQFPSIGPLNVAGMTFEEMKRFLSKKAANIIGTEISVTMGRLRSIQVFVLGEVKKPGPYSVSAMSTITSALFAGGGPTDIGSLRKIELKREGKLVSELDFYDMLLRGDRSRDARLHNGDVIFVPMVGPLAGITGNVKRPAVYEIKGPSDLSTLLELAGGIIPAAYVQQLQIERIHGNANRIVIDLNASTDAAIKGFNLQDGDLVKVFSIFDKDVNAVYLSGNVKRPGKYELKSTMRIRDIIKNDAELLSDTYLEYALVKRTLKPAGEVTLIPFSLIDLFKGVEEANIELKPQDSVYVFSKWLFKDRPMVTIGGEVRKGGSYELEGGMTIKDLVLKAGDLISSAYLGEAELYRTDPKSKEVRFIRFNLKKAMDGDETSNLALKNADRVVIHSVWEVAPRQLVNISGEVSGPGQYQYASNMKISDLIFAGGNLLESAYLDEAELTSRVVKDNDISVIVVRKVNLRKALSHDPSEDIPVKPYDSLFVKKIPEWGLERRITISGEVKFPGTYIIKKGEKLNSVIERAGGFTDKAYLKGAVFTRESIKASQQAVLNDYMTKLEKTLLTQTSFGIENAVSAESAKQQEGAVQQKKDLIEKMKEVKATGRVVIRLSELDRFRDTGDDLALEDGDTLTVPEKPSVVSVSGSVMNPMSFVYDSKTGISEYISKAGGATPTAAVKNTYIIKADGSSLSPEAISKGSKIWYGGSHFTRLDPGDTVVVPERTEQIAWMREIKDLTQILYQIAVTAGVLIVAF